MRAILATAVAVALAAAAAASRSDATPAPASVGAKVSAPVLGISYRTSGGVLAWFDPLTLRALPGRKVRLGSYGHSWAFSANRAVLAVASCSNERSGAAPGLRFVNARAMRVLGDVRLAGRDGCVGSLAWLRPDRLLAVVTTGSSAELVVIDPLRRRVVRHEPLPAAPWGVGRTPDEIVLLLATYDAIAPARIAMADAEGTVRVATLDGVLAGTVVDEQSDDHHARTVHPGLAVDPDGRRAFVVPAAGPIGELDLRTSALSYRRLDAPSPLGGLVGWLFPDAEAKLLEGPVRQARWLGEGRIAVSGMDHTLTRNAAGERTIVVSPVGLTLVDTRSWSSRRLDAEASGFAVAGDVVVGMGGRLDPGQEQGTGPGLRAFGVDGRERWRLFPGQHKWMDVAGALGYAYHADESRADVVELATGAVLGSVRWSDRAPLPQLLAAQTSNW